METFDIENLKIEVSDVYDELLLQKGITLSILRLDKIHNIISGNKIFKLYFFLQKAISSNKKIITFGGAYSNHLAAAARACSHYGLQSIGIVRGEKPKIMSDTLLYCIDQGMQLEFISRSDYKQKMEKYFLEKLQLKYGDHILIPEGGFGDDGVKGVAAIYKYIPKDSTHICCAAGTGATMAGLINAAHPDQTLIGFSALRNFDFEKRIMHLTDSRSIKNYYLINDYHFGGYAKNTNELIDFMNTFYKNYSIPLDFVYTGKMMFGVLDLIRKNHFTKGSKIICVHTGGLQGNASLQPGVLNF